jgi:two-component system response regulator PilR (NtrC family)
MAQLMQHPLNGNVRELENLLHRAVALCDGDELQLDYLQIHADSPMSLAEAVTPLVSTNDPSAPGLPADLQGHLDQQERDILIQTLKATGFNRTSAASRLGLSLRQIRYRIARLKIETPQPSDDPSDA